MSIDDRVAAVALKQCWVFTRAQVHDTGGDDGLIRRRVQAGRWERLRPGVYGLPSHGDYWSRRLWIVYLAAGEHAVVSHETAAAVGGVPGSTKDLLALTVPHPEHQRVAGAVVHQSRYLPPHHWVNLWGRRTTTFARTLVDLAPTTSRARLDQAFQHGIVTGRLTLPSMARTFGELLVPGRRGLSKLGAVLDERATGPIPPASELERLLFEIAASVGLVPIPQHPLPGHQGVEGCVDGALPDARLILEADGRRWHTRVADFARDLARDVQAARAGWDTLRFPWEYLTGDPDDAAAAMLETYQQRRALSPAPADPELEEIPARFAQVFPPA